MSDKDREPFQSSFSGRPKVDIRGSRVTSDVGLLLVRKLDERLDLNEFIEEHFTATRQGENKSFPMADLLPQSVCSRLAGFEDLNDAARGAAGPAFRQLGSHKNWNRGGTPLNPMLPSFKTETLAGDAKLIGLIA